jgi:RNA polymerase sigma-70 factor (ECF subfamily)
LPLTPGASVKNSTPITTAPSTEPDMSPDLQLVRDERHAEDLDLARRALAGEAAARLRLAGRLLDRVRATCFYLVGGEERDDLVQESLAEILASLGSFGGRSRLETWADRIALRTILRLRTRRGDERRAGRSDPDHLAAPGPSAESAARETEVRRHLARALGKLSPPRQEALVLFAVHRYTAEEIAGITGAPVETVRDRIKVARQKLRDLAQRDPVLREWSGGEFHGC